MSRPKKMIIVVQRPNMSMKYRSVDVLFKNIVLTVFKTYSCDKKYLEREKTLIFLNILE